MFCHAVTAFLFMAAPADDSILVQFEFDEYRYRLGDVAFGRVTIKNCGQEPVHDVPTRFASLVSTAFYDLSFTMYPYSFQFVYADSAKGQGKGPNQSMKPGESRIVDYPLLGLPEPKHFDHDFWLRAVDHPGRVGVTLRLDWGAKRLLKSAGELRLCERPEREMEFLRKLFRESEVERDAGGGNHVLYRPHPSYFGVNIVHEHLIERLIAFEAQLSPGTLRDIVKLTRLVRVLYSPKDPETRDATIAELLKWLDTLPAIEREVFAIQLDSYMRDRNHSDGRLDPRLHPEYCDLLRGVIQYMPESAYGSATFRQDHLRYLDRLEE